MVNQSSSADSFRVVPWANRAVVGVVIAALLSCILGAAFIAALLLNRHMASAAERAGPTVTIEVSLPGTAVEEVEQLATVPIEKQVQGMEGLASLKSISRSERSILWIEFAPGIDLFEARQRVANRLSALTPSLPGGATPTISPPVGGEVLLVGLWSERPAAGEDPGRLWALAEQRLRPRLLAIPGVASVLISDNRVGQIVLFVAPEKLAAHGLSLAALATALERHTQQAPGAQTPERDPMVRTLGRLSPEDLGDVTVSVDRAAGAPVRLKDVAEVRFVAKRRDPPQPDGQPSEFAAVLLALWSQPGFDARAPAGVDRQIADSKRLLPPEILVGRKLPARLVPLIEQTAEKIRRDLPPDTAVRAGTSDDGAALLTVVASGRCAVRVSGADWDATRGATRELAGRLRRVAGVSDIRVEPADGEPQLHFDIDRASASRLGVTLSDVTMVVAIATGERVVGRIRSGEREAEIVLTLDPKVQQDPKQWMRLTVPTANGQSVPLESVVRVEHRADLKSIYREAGERVGLISFDVSPERRSQALDEIRCEISGAEGRGRCRFELKKVD